MPVTVLTMSSYKLLKVIYLSCQGGLRQNRFSCEPRIKKKAHKMWDVTFEKYMEDVQRIPAYVYAHASPRVRMP